MGTGIFILAVGGLLYLAYSFVSGSPADGLYKIGLEMLEEENYSDAEQYFLRALELDPAHLPTIEKLIFIYEKQDAVDKLKIYLKRVVKSSPNPFDKFVMNAEMKLAEISYEERKFQEAWQTYILLLKMGYLSADLFFRLGELFMIQKRYGEAVFYFDESLALSPNQPLILYYKGLSLIAMKEFKEAIQPLSLVDDAPEIYQQATFLLGKVHYDLGLESDALDYFGSLLTQKEPIFLSDILLYKSYHILRHLRKDKPNEEELNKLIQYLNRGCSIKGLPVEVRLEYLFHLAGSYLLKNAIDEAKSVFRDLSKLDSFYRGTDQIYKAISKEMLIKEERDKITEIYKAGMTEMQISHAISSPIDLNEFFPSHLPVLVLDQLEENAQRRYLERLKKVGSAKLNFSTVHPRSAIELANSSYDVFVATCVRITGKMGVVVGKNLSEELKTEAYFVGIDRNDDKTFIYFSKPVSLTGALSIVNITELKEKMGASRLSYVSCGTFTEEAKERAKDMRVSLYDKDALKRLL
jgi:tetratricopeptide (TPR) repeat protein